MLFRHICPVADGHVLAMLAGVEALFDTDGFEIGAPEVLEKLLVLGKQFLIQLACTRVEGATVVGEGDFCHFIPVVVATVVAADVVDNPRLVGKAVLEVGDDDMFWK